MAAKRVPKVVYSEARIIFGLFYEYSIIYGDLHQKSIIWSKLNDIALIRLCIFFKEPFYFRFVVGLRSLQISFKGILTF